MIQLECGRTRMKIPCIRNAERRQSFRECAKASKAIDMLAKKMPIG